MATSNIKDRITSRTTVDPDTGCWNWSGYIEKNGYAKITVLRKSKWAHRVSFEEYVGNIPENHDVCHSCDNRKCVNPSHLFAGTRLDNMKDAAMKNRIAKGLALPQTKLTTPDKEKITDLARAGIKYETIGEKFGICRQAAGRIAIQQGVRRHGLGK